MIVLSELSEEKRLCVNRLCWVTTASMQRCWGVTFRTSAWSRSEGARSYLESPSWSRLVRFSWCSCCSEVSVSGPQGLSGFLPLTFSLSVNNWSAFIQLELQEWNPIQGVQRRSRTLNRTHQLFLATHEYKWNQIFTIYLNSCWIFQ